MKFYWALLLLSELLSSLKGDESWPIKDHTGSKNGDADHLVKRSADWDDELEEVETAGDLPDKRHFGFILGRGFKLGKRNRHDQDGVEKRLFGNVLGRGFAFGKRDSSNEFLDKKRRFGSVLGGGFKFGKRNRADKRYGTVFGGPFLPRKRETPPVVHNNLEFEKLGNQRRENDIQKRYGNEDSGFEFVNKDSKRRYGSVLGGGFKFGKRDGTTFRDEPVWLTEDEIFPGYYIDYSDPYDFIHPIPDKRGRFGHILGHGFNFGKRHKDDNLVDKRRFGRILGSGFKFGKRDIMDTGAPYKRFVGDDPYLETADIPRPLVANGDDDSLWDAGEVYLLDDMSLNGPDELLAYAPEKRRYGSVLGGGFKFGKRGV